MIKVSNIASNYLLLHTGWPKSKPLSRITINRIKSHQ